MKMFILERRIKPNRLELERLQARRMDKIEKAREIDR